MTDWQTRLRRLIALAEDQAGTPEGDLAARLARQIMDARRTELQDLDLESRNAADPFERVDLALGGEAYWRRRVASLTARHCECLCSFAGSRARLSGRRSNVLIAEYLYRVMSRFVSWEQTAWLGRHGLLDDPQAANDFAQSAVLALSNRLEEMRRGETHDAQTTALVRVDEKALQDWLTAQGVRFKPEAPFPYRYSQDGYETGNRMPLHKAVTQYNSET